MSEGSFECRVSGKRESAAGIYLTLQIQPDDYTPDLATMRVGSFLMLGWAEVVNTAVEPIEVKLPTTASEPKANGPSKKFHELPLSQQAAIRCGDVLFQEFMKAENEEDAKHFVYRACGVTSRSQIRIDEPSGDSWDALEIRYQAWATDRKFAEAKR